jgi:hypothetical protein
VDQQQLITMLEASIPYVTAVTSYFWRLTSPTKQGTLIRYVYLAAFAYASVVGAYFVAGWVLVVVTGLVLVAGAVVLRPKEDGASAELRRG